MGLVDAARALAETAHQGQLRKGGHDVPYVTHLRRVAERVARAGIDDEVTIAAAWLHDLLEDQPAFADRLRAEFPETVVKTVEALSEPKRGEDGRMLAKEVRFAAYVAGLSQPTEAVRRALPVSCADKIDNLASLVEGERRGEKLLAALRTRPGQQRRHLAHVRALYQGSVPPSLLADFDEASARLFAYVTEWLPGHAVAIAAEAHRGQFDRAGAPYIFHPLRLMMRAESATEKMVAVLHDVVEDTPWELTALAEEGFPEPVIAALDRLTKRDGEDYETFIERIAADPLAARVKLLDLEDNMTLARLPTVDANDLERLAKYHRARRRLLDSLAPKVP